MVLDPAVCDNLERTPAGAAWIASLNDVVSLLAHTWGLADIGPPMSGGSHSFVALVATRHGAQAVLKVPFQDEENRHEAQALKLYAGDGAVELFAVDEESGAMLLEAAVPGTPLEEHSNRTDAIAIGCALLRRLRRSVPEGHPFTLVHDRARAWSPELLARCDDVHDPTARRLLTTAAAMATDLSRPVSNPVLVNRDAHFGNVLAAQREPWLLIDPKPLVGDAAFDAGYLIDWLLGEHATRSHADDVVNAVASELDVDRDRARAWAVVRAMDNYTWALFEQGDDPTVYAEAATALIAR